MRVIQVTPRSWSPQAAGGGERYFNELTRALRELPDMCVGSFALERGRVVEIGERRERPVGLRRFLRTLAKADVVHVHQLNSAAFDIVCAAELFRGRPFVLTDHGGGWRTLGRLVPRAVRLNAVSAVAAVSAYSLKDLGWPASRPSAVVWGGGDHIRREDGDTSSLTSVDLLFVGRLLPHKGVHLLIEALPPGMSLRVAGRVVEERFLRELRNLSKLKDVDFYLNPPDAELNALYARASYTVLPSVTEAFGRRYARPELLGLTLLESLSMGTPCVASPVGGAEEVCEAAGMPMLSMDSISEARTSLEHLPSPYSSSYIALRDRAEAAASLFSWRRVAQACLGLYHSLDASAMSHPRRLCVGQTEAEATDV